MEPILHLSIVVASLDDAQAFYVDLLGCTPGRRTPAWMDVWFFGLQLTLQAQPEAVQSAAQTGKRHFGVTLDRPTFDALRDRIDQAGLVWLDPVTTSSAGTPLEQTKGKLLDPSSNVLEFKTYPDVARAFTDGRRCSTWNNGAKLGMSIRPQYNFWPGEQGYDAWDVQRLINLSSHLPIREVPLASITEFDSAYWQSQNALTVREIAEHAKLIAEADRSYPIILAADGRVMDGMHRVAQAWINGSTTILAVQFLEQPEPDFRDIDPGSLP
ncbi:MAG: VOC family protein [Actinomycetota bacterium]